jgi:hypothetical protein
MFSVAFFISENQSGKVKEMLEANSVAISKSLEIREGYAWNILSVIEQPESKVIARLSNPYRLPWISG